MLRSKDHVHEDEARFRAIATRLQRQDERVTLGRMMSSPGIRYGDRIFAFYYRGNMAFRLGKDFDLASAGVKRSVPLNPFKTKPPLTGWFAVPPSEADKWEDLAKLALRLMVREGRD